MSADNAINGADLLGGRRNCQSARCAVVVGELEAAECGTRREAMRWRWVAGMVFVSELASRGFPRVSAGRREREQRGVSGDQGPPGCAVGAILRADTYGRRQQASVAFRGWRVFGRVFEFMTWRDPRRRAGCPRNGQEQGVRNRVVSGGEEGVKAGYLWARGICRRMSGGMGGASRRRVGNGVAVVEYCCRSEGKGAGTGGALPGGSARVGEAAGVMGRHSVHEASGSSFRCRHHAEELLDRQSRPAGRRGCHPHVGDLSQGLASTGWVLPSSEVCAGRWGALLVGLVSVWGMGILTTKAWRRVGQWRLGPRGGGR